MPNMTCVKEDILCPFLEINTKSTDHREILPIQFSIQLSIKLTFSVNFNLATLLLGVCLVGRLCIAWLPKKKLPSISQTKKSAREWEKWSYLNFLL